MTTLRRPLAQSLPARFRANRRCKYLVFNSAAAIFNGQLLTRKRLPGYFCGPVDETRILQPYVGCLTIRLFEKDTQLASLKQNTSFSDKTMASAAFALPVGSWRRIGRGCCESDCRIHVRHCSAKIDMKRMIFRLMVVLLGQLCCLVIGLGSGALNVGDLQVKARSERITAASSPNSASEFAGQPVSLDLPSPTATR